MSNLLYVFGIALLGGALYRWRGHASKYKKYFPRPFNQIAFSLPYAYLCYQSIGLWALVVLGLTTAAVLSGHGRWMDLGTWKYKSEPERLEFLIIWLHRKIPEYWYDVLGMTISGLSITLPAGIVLGNPVIALSGALKAAAYMIGWRFFDEPTAWGEFFTGLFLWFCLAIHF